MLRNMCFADFSLNIFKLFRFFNVYLVSILKTHTFAMAKVYLTMCLAIPRRLMAIPAKKVSATGNIIKKAFC